MTDLRARLESWREARVRARMAWLTGESAELDIATIDEEYLDITSGDPLGALRSELEQASFEDARERLARLVAMVRAAVVGRALHEINARVRARPGAVELLEERVARESEAVAALGFANVRELDQTLRPGIDYGYWAAQAEALLAATRGAHRDALRALRQLDWDEALPAARLRPTLDFALEGMSLAPSRAQTLRVDDEASAARREPAWSCAPLVPREVWLGYAPAPGWLPLEALFAAAGSALHAAFSAESLPLECRVVGDPAALLVWRHFLLTLLAEPSFVEAGPGGGRAAELGALLRARRLDGARRCAALVPCELALAELSPGSDPHGLESLYAKRCEDALGRTPDEAAFLVHCSAQLRSVDELRALAVAAELVRHLRERFGRSFWTVRAAGALVQELMHTGTTYAPEALARELGLAAPGAEPLVGALV